MKSEKRQSKTHLSHILIKDLLDAEIINIKSLQVISIVVIYPECVCNLAFLYKQTIAIGSSVPHSRESSRHGWHPSKAPFVLDRTGSTRRCQLLSHLFLELHLLLLCKVLLVLSMSLLSLLLTLANAKVLSHRVDALELCLNLLFLLWGQLSLLLHVSVSTHNY